MFELTINGIAYKFNFGMGFMREINKLIVQPVDDLKNVSQNIGLRYYVLCLLGKDIEALVKVLETANKGQDTRVTGALLDAYIDDADTDIDKLFGDVLDFLKRANATKSATMAVIEAHEAQTAAQK